MDKQLLKKSIPQLRKIAERHCHAFVRKRDQDEPCISCDRFRTLQAGHFHSGGSYSCVKLNQFNVHGQCEECNCMKDGNHDEYRPRLLVKIGPILLAKLDNEIAHYRKVGWKWDRFELIDIIEDYKEKIQLL